jgi:hypothetical protein
VRRSRRLCRRISARSSSVTTRPFYERNGAVRPHCPVNWQKHPQAQAIGLEQRSDRRHDHSRRAWRADRRRQSFFVVARLHAGIDPRRGLDRSGRARSLRWRSRCRRASSRWAKPDRRSSAHCAVAAVKAISASLMARPTVSATREALHCLAQVRADHGRRQRRPNSCRLQSVVGLVASSHHATHVNACRTFGADLVRIPAPFRVSFCTNPQGPVSRNARFNGAAGKD